MCLQLLWFVELDTLLGKQNGAGTDGCATFGEPRCHGTAHQAGRHSPSDVVNETGSGFARHGTVWIMIPGFCGVRCRRRLDGAVQLHADLSQGIFT